MTLGSRSERPRTSVSVVKISKATSQKKQTRVRQLEVLVLELVRLVEQSGGEKMLCSDQWETVHALGKLVAHERDDEGDKHDGSPR